MKKRTTIRMKKPKIPSKEANTAMVADDDPVDDVRAATASAVPDPNTAGEGSRTEGSSTKLLVLVKTLSVA